MLSAAFPVIFILPHFSTKSKGAAVKYSSLSYLFISKSMRLLLLLQRSRLDDEFHLVTVADLIAAEQSIVVACVLDLC